MKRGSPMRQRLAAIGLAGWPLLTFPLLGLPEGSIGGIPAIYHSLFGVWGGLIGLAAWIGERKG